MMIPWGAPQPNNSGNQEDLTITFSVGVILLMAEILHQFIGRFSHYV